MSISKLKKELKSLANARQARLYQRFFKTGKGEYGEGDRFLGIKVPVLRRVAKNYVDLELTGIKTLLFSSIHEQRFMALVILCEKYKKADSSLQGMIFKFYMSNAPRINNWDLVDVSAPNIPGDWLREHRADRKILYKFATSTNLWERRIAIMSTFGLIRVGEFADALAISEILLHDEHDLIHKAVGWMLREIGKRNLAVEEKFLDKYYKTMPRTMLRYAIERFDPVKKKYYMS